MVELEHSFLKWNCWNLSIRHLVLSYAVMCCNETMILTNFLDCTWTPQPLTSSSEVSGSDSLASGAAEAESSGKDPLAFLVRKWMTQRIGVPLQTELVWQVQGQIEYQMSFISSSHSPSSGTVIAWVSALSTKDLSNWYTGFINSTLTTTKSDETYFKHGNTDLHNRVFLTSMCQNASRFVIFSVTNFYIRRRKVSRAFLSISHVVVISHLDMLRR